MVTLDVSIDPTWAIGLLLAQVRVIAFVVAAPQLGKAVPRPGRVAFALAIGLALAVPVPVAAGATLAGWALVNAAVGAMLGYLVGVLFNVFAVAGAMADISAATSIASVLDPTRGEQGAVFSRLFQITGLTFFHVAGGLTLLVTTLAWSVRAVPLDGRLRLSPGLGTMAVELVSTLMVAGFELAIPLVASLFLIELTMGLAARFAPTANIFMLGLPVKVGVAFMVTVTSLAMFPHFTTALMDTSRDTVVDVLNGIGVPAS